MESYVESFIDVLDEEGYEYEVEDDDDEVEIYLTYELDDDDVTVKISFYSDLVLFKAMVDDDMDFSLESLEYANRLNSHVAQYRFFIGKEGGMLIERTRAIESFYSDFVITATIMNEVKMLCKACIKLRYA